MNLTSKLTDPQKSISHWKFLGEINLTDKINMTDDCEISLWLFSNKRRTPLMYLR